MTRRSISYINSSQLLNLGSCKNIAIVDVRDERDIGDPHIAGSIHYASGEFVERIPELIKDIKDTETVVFHCAFSKIRGPTCAQTFARYLADVAEDVGIKEVVVLKGGFDGWMSSGHPTCDCTSTCCRKYRDGFAPQNQEAMSARNGMLSSSE